MIEDSLGAVRGDQSHRRLDVLREPPADFVCTCSLIHLLSLGPLFPTSNVQFCRRIPFDQFCASLERQAYPSLQTDPRNYSTRYEKESSCNSVVGRFGAFNNKSPAVPEQLISLEVWSCSCEVLAIATSSSYTAVLKMAELEHAALSGELFSPRSPSPSRSTSTSSPQNTDDELGSDLSAPPSPSLPSSTGAAPPASTGPQTGPKGVISDRRARTAADQAQSARQRQELRAAQERQAIVGLTVDEEAEEREREELLKETRDEDARKEREDDASAWEAWRARRREELGQRAGDRGNSGGGSKGLREVGQEGFVGAVERPGWVVVLIYEPVGVFSTGT